jgi:hypothetical protein
MENLRIDYTESSYLGIEDKQISDFVKYIFFSIYDDRDTLIGEGHFIIIDFDDYDNSTNYLDFSLYDLIDYNGQTLNFFEEIALPKLFDKDYYNIKFFKSFFRKKFNNYFLHHRIGYLDTINIKENYQGKNIGSLVLKNLQDRFAYSLDYIAVKPYPLEFEIEPKDEFLKAEFDLKKEKIINFYKNNGYEQLAKSDYYILILR